MFGFSLTIQLAIRFRSYFPSVPHALWMFQCSSLNEAPDGAGSSFGGLSSGGVFSGGAGGFGAGGLGVS